MHIFQIIETIVVSSGIKIKIVDIQNGTHCNQRLDFHPLADHVTKLRNFTKEDVEFLKHL